MVGEDILLKNFLPYAFAEEAGFVLCSLLVS